MEKLKMHSPNFAEENIERLAELFPNCVVESVGAIHEFPLHETPNTKIWKSIDWDLLKQELANHIVEGPQERYRLDWPGKRKALLTANAPIAKTLRPCREESVDFDKTENLFIEGDNLDALKLLQETYLGKIKMIYIDPPYNTGKDFVYKDRFTIENGQWKMDSGDYDDEGNRLVANTDSNGRFHSDWLSMMYPRLKLARNLLKDDGVIFISIDDNEVHNFRKICDEIFGAENFRNTILVRRRVKSLNSQFSQNGLQTLNIGFEYIIIYAKSHLFSMEPLRMKKRNASKTGRWDVFWSNADRPTMRYEILGFTPETGQWRYSQEKAISAVQNYKKYQELYANKMTLEEYWEHTGKCLRFIRRIANGKGKNGGVQHWVSPSDTALRTSNWTDIEVSQIHKEINLPFDNPKNRELPQELIKLSGVGDNDIILDFFAGSSTTAHAVMQLNAEDSGKRKFIMVQLPEETNEKSEAFKAGYKTIAEISKERIRRAGKKIIENLQLKIDNEKKQSSDLFKDDINPQLSTLNSPLSIDIGFRVLKVDSSNMADVYYTPDTVEQTQLEMFTDNIKSDRTPEDLLFQVLLDWGVDLTLPITKEIITAKTTKETKKEKKFEVSFVDSNALAACFVKDGGITEDFCKELAKRQPLRVVFRDSGFKDDSVKINVEQIFKLMSPHTEVKTI